MKVLVQRGLGGGDIALLDRVDDSPVLDENVLQMLRRLRLPEAAGTPAA